MKKTSIILLSSLSLTLPGVSALKYFTHGGHGYAIESSGANWLTANAAAAAATKNGWSNPHLVHINDQLENNKILTELQSLGISTTAADGGGAIYAWIGAQETIEGNFQWTDGRNTPFWTGGQSGSGANGLYQNFGSYTTVFGPGQSFTNQEPDNFQGQDRVAISTNGWPQNQGPSITPASPGQWNDIQGTNQLAYIIEFDSIPEPSSLLLLSLGALAGITRRKR